MRRPDHLGLGSRSCWAVDGCFQTCCFVVDCCLEAVCPAPLALCLQMLETYSLYRRSLALGRCLSCCSSRTAPTSSTPLLPALATRSKLDENALSPVSRQKIRARQHCKYSMASGLRAPTQLVKLPGQRCSCSSKQLAPSFLFKPSSRHAADVMI